MSEIGDADRPRKDRSPSYPFISLRKAMERAEQLQAVHKREAARLASVASTWGYGAKSSGLLQTVAALKQFGLIEDSGSGEDRKIQVTDLARRISTDTRPGVKEKALIEAAKKPRLFSEYIDRWVPDAPSDAHCISELEFDRGFTSDAARLFMKSFKLTIEYAGLLSHAGGERAQEEYGPGGDRSPDDHEDDDARASRRASEGQPEQPGRRDRLPLVEVDSDSYSMGLDSAGVSVTARLLTREKLDELVERLQALRVFLPETKAD